MEMGLSLILIISSILCWIMWHSNILTNCEKKEEGYGCTRTCESVWFKIWDKEKSEYGNVCTDPAFLKGYANIMYSMYRFMI